MVDDPRADLVRKYWRNWAARDKAASMKLLGGDFFYGLYVPEEVLPFGGETRGRAAVSDRLQMILNQFDTLLYEGTITKIVDDTIHGRVTYSFRHKATGEVIDGHLRQEVEVRDGLIVSWREYTDTEKVRAFMRLVAHVAGRNG